MKLGIDPNALRPILDPHVSIEETFTCDGEECGRSFADEEGNLLPLPAHYHIHLTDPNGGYRIFAAAKGEQLPETT